MGQAGSNVYRTMTAPFRSWQSSADLNQGCSGQGDPLRLTTTPYIYKRRGSQYFDEDGQLAHEFYELKENEVTHTVCMTKLDGNLVPQGEIELPFPRLHTDLPIVICEAKMDKTRL